MKSCKNFISLFLTTILLLSFAACGKNDSYPAELGNINTVDITEYAEEEINSPFIKQRGLSYEYKQVSAEYMNLSLDIPKEWKAATKNARYISFETPSDDPYVPGVTFNLLMSPLSGGEETLIPSQIENLFTNDLEGITYCLNEKTYIEKYNDDPSEVYSDTDISEETGIFSFIVYDDVYAEDEDGHPSDSPLTSIHADIFWDDRAITLRTLITADYKDAAKDVIKDLVSGLCYEKESSPCLESLSLEDVEFLLPDSFDVISVQGCDCIYAGTKTSSKYSGIGLSQSTISIDPNEFDRLSFAREVVPGLAGKFLSPSKFKITGSLPDAPVNISLGGKNAWFILENISYVATEYEPASFYGYTGSAVLFIYVLPSEADSHKVITLFSPSAQIDQAGEINNLIMNNAKFK